MVAVLKNEDIIKEKLVVDEVLAIDEAEQTVDIEGNKEVWSKITNRVNHFKELLLTWLFPVPYNPWDLIDSFEEYRAVNNTDYKRKDVA